MTRTVLEDLYNPNIVDPEAEPTGPANMDVVDVGPVVSEDQKTVERSLKRLHDYINQSFAESDPEAAMLGVANGTLIKMLFSLERSINSVLAERPSGPEHLAVVLRGIDAALRLTLQIDRFTRLRILLKSTRETVARLGKS